jgi:protein TonB
VIHVVDLQVGCPESSTHGWIGGATTFLLSAGVHAVAILVLATFVKVAVVPPPVTTPRSPGESTRPVRRVVFVAPPAAGRGGGGGGNRHPGPIRRGEAIGTDSMTLRAVDSVPSARTALTVPTTPAVLLDAAPLASGTIDQIGLPIGGVSYGTSTGSGSGGGVGEGTGTGIGSGTGPGIGPGSGGGTGGGVYLLGSGVTAPRPIIEVRPTYTVDALFERIEGTVVLEFVVRADGVPSNIRVVRSLDPGRLDDASIHAVSRWRFDPGRVAGIAVDVRVRLAIDFSIR